MLKYISIQNLNKVYHAVMNIFTKRAQSARMMLDEASSPFCIPEAGQ